MSLISPVRIASMQQAYRYQPPASVSVDSVGSARAASTQDSTFAWKQYVSISGAGTSFARTTSEPRTNTGPQSEKNWDKAAAVLATEQKQATYETVF